MKLAKRRASCAGCRAYGIGRCELGFLTKTIRYGWNFDHQAPAEPCPRPRTNDDYMAIRAEQHALRNPPQPNDPNPDNRMSGEKHKQRRR